MSPTKHHRLLVAFLFALAFSFSATICATAQNNSTESPYTRFGYGSLSSYSSTRQRALGGVSIATRLSDHINPGNPASYAAVDSQTFIFDLGATIGFSHLTEGVAHDTRILGNLEYATVLFPITHWMALSAGILPYSSVGYRFGNTGTLPQLNNLQYTEKYNGVGNINDIFLGIGVMPLRGLSIGANVSYRFGSLLHQRSIEYQSSSAFNPFFYERLTLKGVGVKAGLQYGFALNPEKEILVGVTYSPSLAFLSRLERRELIKTGNQVSGVIRNDTITSKSDYKSPHEIGVGVSYCHKNKLFVEADVQYNIWQNALLDNPLYTPQNQLSFAIGTSFIPNAADRSLGNRIEYRLGIRGANSYLALPSPTSKKVGYLEGGLSFGIGIPLVDRRSTIDLTIDYKHLMPRTKGMISENYLMLTVGLRFNEGWFKPLKID